MTLSPNPWITKALAEQRAADRLAHLPSSDASSATTPSAARKTRRPAHLRLPRPARAAAGIRAVGVRMHLARRSPSAPIRDSRSRHA